MSFAPGVRLGGYEIIGHLGSGGMGDVFRASDVRLGRDVAIKVLPGAVANDPGRLRRFEIEARTVAALSHPNILSVFDTGVFEGSPYIVTELLEGETLRQKLDHGPAAPRRAIEWGLATARGLAAAHAKSIVHRDIKPENLLITKDGRLKILDFGLAKQLPAAPSTESQTTALLSSPGAVMGTPAYMSPEQVRGEALGAGSDLFSLGCVLYEMLAGRRPFLGDTAMDVMSAILREEPPEFTAQPPGLAGIIRRCLEKDREARFHSAADLAFALEALSNPSAASSPDISASPVARKSRAGMYGILAVASVLAAMLAGWWWLGRRQSAVRTPVFERLTFQTGSIDRARFGADGKTFVYSADWRGLKNGVYSTVLGNPESRPLALPDGVRLASVSSTGELALLKGSVLSRARMDGTAPRDVATDIEDADWSPDGSQLAVIRNLHPGFQIEYPLGKTIAKAGWSPTIRVSPKGDRIALLRVNKGGDVISTLDLQGQFTDLVPHLIASMQDQFCWSPDGREVWFIASSGGTSFDTLKAVTLSGKVREIYQFPGVRVNIDSAASDGRVLLRIHHLTNQLMANTADQGGERDLTWLDAPDLTDLSADGGTVMFSNIGQSGSSHYGIYIRSTDGSPAVRLSDGLGELLSPDLKWVTATIPSGQQVLIPTGAGEPQALSFPGLTGARIRAFLPNGTGYVVSGFETGKRLRIYTYSLALRRLQPVSGEGLEGSANELFVSPDGSQVVFSASSRATILPLKGGEPRKVDLEPADRLAGFAADSHAVFVLHKGGHTPAAIYRVDLATGKRSLLHELVLPEGYSVDSLRVTPDGRRYALMRSSKLSELYMAEGIDRNTLTVGH
jgi:Tol biopolymer transport system component